MPHLRFIDRSAGQQKTLVGNQELWENPHSPGDTGSWEKPHSTGSSESREKPHSSNILNENAPFKGNIISGGLEASKAKLDYIREKVCNMHRAVRQSGVHNFQKCRLPVSTQVNTQFLEHELVNYHDFKVVEFLKFGFPINYEGPELGETRTTNHKGAVDFPDEIGEYIKKEISMGAIIGPFTSNPLISGLKFNPLNSCPKRESPDRRVIVDLSFPRGTSVNSGISKDTYLGQPANLKYPSIDDLVEVIKSKGRGCSLFKRDLKRAYRQFPVDPGDINMLAFRWQGAIFIDVVLPMGLRSAALCCQRVTNAVNFICRKRDIQVVNYLDDFGGAERWDKAQEAYEGLAQVLQQCGLVEAADKACEPQCVMTFLGIQLNTLDLTLTITQDRLDEIAQLLHSWEAKTSTTRQELQELLGKLHFVSCCVRPGRVLVSRLLNYLRELPEQGKRAIPEEALADVKWWLKYMPIYNGVSMMPWDDWSEPDLIFSSDACLTGCGAWVEDQCFSCRFPQHILSHNLHINALELLTIVVAIKIWGDRWKGKRIQVYCDNMVSVAVINSGATKDAFLQKCLREILFFAAKHEFEIRSRHIQGVENRISDLLSRAHLGGMYETGCRKSMQDFGLDQVQVAPETFTFEHDW